MIRVVIVGFGEMGKNYHLPTLRGNPAVSIVGIVRRSKEPICELPDALVFDNYERAMADLRPDLCIIATPHVFHAQQVRFALEQGSHVFVEKPIALDYAEAEELVSLAQKLNKLLVVGLQRRYEGFFSIVRELKANGGLGKITFGNGLFAHTFDSVQPTGWRGHRESAGAGILDDSAYHILDILLSASGDTKCKIAGCKVIFSKANLPESFSAVFELGSGCVITASGSYIAPRLSVQEEFSLYGENGAVFARRFCLDWNANPPLVFYKSRDGSVSKQYDLSDRPSGRTLPLGAMLGFLTGELPRSAILTEGESTLPAHFAVSQIKEDIR